MGNSASALPYSIGKKVDESDGWVISEGTTKSNGAPVTVFVAHKPLLIQKQLLEPARHHFMQCKKLRHPNLLNVHATLDTDAPADGSSSTATTTATTKGDYIIVTEPCISLQEWLQSAPSPNELAWGLQCMVQALDFLHGTAKLAHGNVSASSWKVTPAGDVKLWNYSLVTSSDISPHYKLWESRLTPTPYRSPERLQGDYASLQAASVHAMDSYGLGILITTELYPGTVPATLQKAVQRLQTPNLKARPRLAPLLKCPLFSTEYSQLQVALQELPVQPVDQQTLFWQRLHTSMQKQPIAKKVAVYKILPLLKTSLTTICSSEALVKQDVYKRQLLAMLPCLFGMWSNQNDDQDEDWTSTLALLFAVKDRAVRGTLLQNMQSCLAHIQPSHQVNTVVFDHMCSGFSDSSPALRELTLKASLQLLEILTPSNLEKLSRYLVRLQGDPEASIRTNAVVLIVKVAPHLGDVQRDKLLMPALQRGMKDTFVPCRLAALNSITCDLFTPEELATRVMPAVVPQVVDATSQVRSKAFEVVNKCLVVLKEHDEKMKRETAANGSDNVTTTAPVSPPPLATAPSNVPAPPSSGSSYLSGLSSWMSSSAKPVEGGVQVAAATTATMNTTSMPSSASMPTPAAPLPPSYAKPTPSVTKSLAATRLNDGWNDDNDDNDGWSDDDNVGDDNDGWGDDDLLGTTKSSPAAATPMTNDDDIFASLDMAAPKVAMRSMGAKKLVVPKAKATPAPAVTKLKVDASDWDDF